MDEDQSTRCCPMTDAVLLIVIAAILHPSFWLIVFIVALAAWLVPARLIRGETLTLRTREYVQAVRANGRWRRSDRCPPHHPQRGPGPSS